MRRQNKALAATIASKNIELIVSWIIARIESKWHESERAPEKQFV